MLTILVVLLAVGEIAFPTFMLCLVYPFSKKAAMFWSNYITERCARIVFAIFKTYRGFEFLGDKKEIDNLPEQFVVVANHQSLLDIVALLKYFQGRKKARFVAKDALNSVPMVGKMLRTQGHCMIPRKGSPSVAMKSIDKFGARSLENDFCPVIFPEGTRSRDGNLGTFYAAGFRRLSESTNLPVVIMALDGGWKISKFDQLFTNLKKGNYRVKVLKVYDAPASKDDEKKILEEAPVMIQAQLDEWRK